MRVVVLTSAVVVCALAASSQPIPQDTGAAGAWQKILKVKTTASVMHTTAHPDDEHGGVITRLSRFDGARLALTTLNRGESGDNAIGPQLFDALGLIRTEELVDAGRYYGIDNQYFTTVIDYGFSKRLEEAFDKWGRDNVLRDLVRIIRMDRPWVLLSRFQGNARDGHGNHQTAGLLTQLAFKAAGDPQQFPEQIAEGLKAWQPFKVYMGGVRENEDWTVRIDGGEYSPWLGDSYDNVARFGLSFQRSQNSGRYSPTAGPNFGYYKRVGERVTAAAKEASLWDGIDTTYAGLFKTLGRTAPADVDAQMAAIDRAVARALREFTMVDPSKAAPGLIEGLTLTREVIAKSRQEPDVLHVLRTKERQFQDAINVSLGLELSALAQSANTPEPIGPGAAFAPPAAMAAPVPGQRFEVRIRLANRGGVVITLDQPPPLRIEAERGWTVSEMQAGAPSVNLSRHQMMNGRFTVTLADDVPLSTRPYFARASLNDSRYSLSDASQFGRTASRPPLVAVARYTIEGELVEIRETVRRREPKLPYGDVLREVRSVPRVAVTVSPSSAIVPLGVSGSISQSVLKQAKRVDVEVAVLHNAETATTGQVALKLPTGWSAEPSSQTFAFARAGERASYKFAVRPGAIGADIYRIDAVASAGGKEYREGYEVIDQRDLEVRYLYRASTVDVRGVNVTTVPGLKVGYVMGIGDQVPLGLQQLGAQVTLLGERELASTDLSTFDAIMTGTRAYAVREDLKTYNQRLLDYVKAGGNMIVLYNTQEMVPAQFAPFPGELPRSAEEVSEEDSPVEILAPTQQAFTWPNQITAADFTGWVEQRGSKFFTTWDAAYTPMIATYDKGQPPQRGGWLTAKVGKGTWTYFAYALHRQLPYSVPGAYRITANLLALGKSPR